MKECHTVLNVAHFSSFLVDVSMRANSLCNHKGRGGSTTDYSGIGRHKIQSRCHIETNMVDEAFQEQQWTDK